MNSICTYHFYRNSINQVKFENFLSFQKQQDLYYQSVTSIFLNKLRTENFNDLHLLYQRAKQHYQAEMIESYHEAGKGTLKDIDIATVFNVNRELYSSNKAIILAVKDFLFDQSTAEHFDQIV